MFHVTFAVQGRFQAFLTEAALRVAVRTLARVAGARLLTWAIPGDHLHALATGTRADIGRLGRNVRLALRAVGTHLLEPHLREITGRDDLENVIAYHLRQPRKHQACDRPALFGGGCFPDLVGARILEGYDPERVLAHLPHFDLGRHRHEVAVRALPTALPESSLRAVGAARIVAASAAALAVGPGLSGNGPWVVAARRTAVALGTVAGIPRSELAFSLECTVQAAGRLAKAARNPKIEQAVRMHLGLEAVASTVERVPAERRSNGHPVRGD